MRWAMMNDGCVCHLFIQRILNFDFGFQINRAGAVVQDQNTRCDQQRAGNGDALFLSAGEIRAARLDEAVVLLLASP